MWQEEFWLSVQGAFHISHFFLHFFFFLLFLWEMPIQKKMHQFASWGTDFPCKSFSSKPLFCRSLSSFKYRGLCHRSLLPLNWLHPSLSIYIFLSFLSLSLSSSSSLSISLLTATRVQSQAAIQENGMFSEPSLSWEICYLSARSATISNDSVTNNYNLYESMYVKLYMVSLFNCERRKAKNWRDGRDMWTGETDLLSERNMVECLLPPLFWVFIFFFIN